jgi:drug/metabolite transporter (DMT)-like permease
MKNLTSEATLTYMLLIQLIVVILYNTYKGYPVKFNVYSMVGGILLSVKDVCGVAAVNNGMEPATVVLSVSLFSSVALMLYNYSITHSFLPQFKNNNNRVETIIELMIAGLSMTVAAYLITHAMPLAPNAGYSKSLSLLSVVLTTGYSVIFLKDKLTDQKLFGVISLIIGCIFVSLFGS